MRAFICRTPDVDAEGVEQLLVLLNSKPGPIRFQNAGEVGVNSDLGANGVTLFRKDAFAAMGEVRQAHKLDDEDALVLLTSLSDERDFFAYGEPAGTGPGHHCIMISGWEDMAAMDFLYPHLAHRCKQFAPGPYAQNHGGMGAKCARIFRRMHL